MTPTAAQQALASLNNANSTVTGQVAPNPANSAPVQALPNANATINSLASMNENQNATIGQAGQNVANANVQYNANQQNLQNSKINLLYNQIPKQQAVIQGLDPKNWQQVESPDGGYRYLDGNGSPISLQQYAQGTGKDPATILKGSTNALDQQYEAEYPVINKIGTAWLQGDQTGLQSIAKQLGFTQGNASGDTNQMIGTFKNAGISTPQDLFSKFMSYYPNVYGNTGQTGQIMGSNVFGPGGQMYYGSP